MPRKATPPSNNRGTRSSEPAGPTSNFSDEGNGSGEEEEEEEEEEESEEEEEEDRGDDPNSGEEEEEEEGEEEEEEGEEEEEEEEGEEGEEEEEEEGEEEEEEEATGDLAELEEIARENGGMVPYARFAEMYQRASRAEQKIIDDAIKDGTITPEKKVDEPPAFDMDVKLRARNAAIMEGDEDKAAGLDKEIQAHTQAVANAYALKTVQETVSASMEKQQTDKAVVAVMKQYPTLKETHKDHNPTKLAIVCAARDVFRAQGMSTAAAIRKAAEEVMGAAIPPAKKGSKGGRDDDPRTPDQKRIALLRAKRQPGKLHKAGAGARATGTAGIDVASLSESKFKRVSPQDKAEARGDFDVAGAKRPRKR